MATNGLDGTLAEVSERAVVERAHRAHPTGVREVRRRRARWRPARGLREPIRRERDACRDGRQRRLRDERPGVVLGRRQLRGQDGAGRHARTGRRAPERRRWLGVRGRRRDGAWPGRQARRVRGAPVLVHRLLRQAPRRLRPRSGLARSGGDRRLVPPEGVPLRTRSGRPRDGPQPVRLLLRERRERGRGDPRQPRPVLREREPTEARRGMVDLARRGVLPYYSIPVFVSRYGDLFGVSERATAVNELYRTAIDEMRSRVPPESERPTVGVLNAQINPETEGNFHVYDPTRASSGPTGRSSTEIWASWTRSRAPTVASPASTSTTRRSWRPTPTRSSSTSA